MPNNQQYPLEIKETLNRMVDITSRVDERLKALEAEQNWMSTRLEHFIEVQGNIDSRLKMVESHGSNILRDDIKILREEFAGHSQQILSLNHHFEGFGTKLKTVFDYAIKALWLLFMAWIYYKFGIQVP